MLLRAVLILDANMHVNLFVSYNISIEPTVDITVTMTNSARANVTVPYNTL